MNSVVTRLSVMMFLEFFTWGAWGPTLGACFSANGLSDAIGGVYGAGPLAAIIAPLFLGLIADRLFPSQVVYGVLMLLGAAFMYLAIGYAQAGDGGMVWWMFIGHMLCYMPTIGLVNTIAFANIKDPNLFPSIRVWGTIGWIAAGLTVGACSWSASFNILWLSMCGAIAAAVYAFTLPHTPPPAKGKPLNLSSLLMADAFLLLANVPFAVFMICSTLICIPLAYYYGYTSNLLTTVGFEQAASTMTIGQMSEIFFMILIPFFFRRLGVKWMILVGMAAWVARYALFALGAPDQVVWMILLGVVLHGVSYDFLFVTGFMYTDQKAPAEVRGQAQSLLVFFTQGIGMWLGFKMAGWRFAETMTSEPALAKAIADSREASTPGFVESMSKMLSVSMPEGVDPELINSTMNQWREFWMLPAMMAAVIAVIFFVAFWDKTSTDVPAGPPHDPATPEGAPV
ncbi:MAG: MFS transporter [Lacipirellulaceae bacterium]